LLEHILTGLNNFMDTLNSMRILPNITFLTEPWVYILEDNTLHNHRCDNLKSYNSVINFVITSPRDL
jgi:hypothetical protein